MVVACSMIRDLYEGRRMARVTSFSFIIFIMVPIVALSLGQWFLSLFEWPMIFVLFNVRCSFNGGTLSAQSSPIFPAYPQRPAPPPDGGVDGDGKSLKWQ
jgi:MFS transporter, DHA1 family, multidrug resistance protein